MAKRSLVFTFPPDFREQPLAYRLIREYDLMLNILHADVRPFAEGHLILEVSGEEANIGRAVKLAESAGVAVAPLAGFVHWDEASCNHCTACIGQCPTQALSVDRETMKVSFDPEICVACGQCVSLCPMDAMRIDID
jgi:ferredoxin